MDLYNIQPLDIPEFLIEIIVSKKTLNDLSKEEFKNILKLPLFETFIQNSIYSNEIYKNKYDLFTKLYIHKELINDFINIWQQITKKLDEKDETDYISNDKIYVKFIDFKNVKQQLENIIVANSINFLKQRIWKFIKSSFDEDLYLQWLNTAILTFISKLKIVLPKTTELDKKEPSYYRLEKWNDINTYIWLYIDSAIKNMLNEERQIIKYPKEFYQLKKIIDNIKENDDDFLHLWYKEILIDFITDIQNKDLKLIQKIWENYFYILWYWEITQNEFVKKYFPKNFDKKLLFSNPENTKIFQINLLPFIKEKEESKKTINELWFTSKITKISEDLNSMSMWFDSLDREIWEEWEWIPLWDLIEQTCYSNYDVEVSKKINLDIFDREIRLTKTPNAHFTLLERIIAWTCIDSYFTFKEFTNLLLEYWKEKWVWDKYVKNFHLFLSLYDFKDKSNWKQYDERTLDAFTFEIMADIFDFSESNACKVYKWLKKKFDNHYEKFWIIFLRYDPFKDWDEIRTFKDLWKPRKWETRLEYIPPQNFQDSYQAKRKII